MTSIFSFWPLRWDTSISSLHQCHSPFSQLFSTLCVCLWVCVNTYLSLNTRNSFEGTVLLFHLLSTTHRTIHINSCINKVIWRKHSPTIFLWNCLIIYIKKILVYQISDRYLLCWNSAELNALTLWWSGKIVLKAIIHTWEDITECWGRWWSLELLVDG